MHNRAAWDRRVDQDDECTRPVSADVIARARAVDWSVVLIGYQPVGRSWLPALPVRLVRDPARGAAAPIAGAGDRRTEALTDQIAQTSPSLAGRLRRGRAASPVRGAVGLPDHVRSPSPAHWPGFPSRSGSSPCDVTSR